MALGDPYATLPQLKDYLLRQQAAQTVDDDELESALNSVSREIQDACERQFNKTAAATARVYYPQHCRLAIVDDFHTTTDLEIATDSNDDGTFDTTWDASDYQLEPLNGVVNGTPGWPYWILRAVESKEFPVRGHRARLQVTAQWGWDAVPDPVKQACLIMASETAKLREAPFGASSFEEFGPDRVRNNPMAFRKLRPYMLNPARSA